MIDIFSQSLYSSNQLIGTMDEQMKLFRYLGNLSEYSSISDSLSVHPKVNFQAKKIHRTKFKKGHKSWNKGLTKETDKRVKGIRKFNNKQVKEIISLYNKKSITKISKKFDCSHSTIFSILKENNITIKGCSYFNKGKPSNMEGKNHTKEANQKNREKHTTKEALKKARKINLGKNNPFYNKTHKKEVIDIIIRTSKERWANPEYKERTLIAQRNGADITPNNPEKIMIELIKKYNLSFNYVGDGQVWFRGKTQSFNPDFFSKNTKQIIEVFGDYWHNLPKSKKKDIERLETYSKCGYKTLVIWASELKNLNQVIDKINQFTNNG